ncbi:hypothetical protein R3P38DRAFT_3375291 [Favolaschia claudopus]|uniref:Uncharacterized protein n=1 Tax=Favolaschia claudopus TaxID=2862362 RepID=A0AAV9ZII8_9AGAR
MSRAQLLEYVRDTQKELGDETRRANTAEKRMRLADTTNRSRSRGRPRKRARRVVVSDDEEGGEDDGEGGDSEEDENDDEEKARLAGHNPPERPSRAKEDSSYTEEKRFDNVRMKTQGELRAVLEVLPEELHGDVGKSWLVHKFNAAMDRQRSNTSTRLRTDCGAVFAAHLEDRVKSAEDLTVARIRASYVDLIGGRENEAEKMEYHPFDAPALHSDGADRHNVETFLKNKLVMHVAAATIFGKEKAKKLAREEVCDKTSRCMKDIHAITNSTPGIIANAAVLTLWGLSADGQLKKRGQQTGIDWHKRQESYLQYLLEGLRQRSKPVMELFRVWDAELFPDTESSLGVAGVVKDGELDAALDALRGAGVEEEDEMPGCRAIGRDRA